MVCETRSTAVSEPMMDSTNRRFWSFPPRDCEKFLRSSKRGLNRKIKNSRRPRACAHDKEAMEARRFFLVLVALLSPLEQARGFNPPCNVRRGESTAAVIKLHSRRHVHDAGACVSALLYRTAVLPPPVNYSRRRSREQGAA